jgi:hypothetical protein
MLDMGITGVCDEFPMGKYTFYSLTKFKKKSFKGNKMLLLPSGGVTLCKTWNLIRLFFLQLIPAVIVDSLLKFKGKRARLVWENYVNLKRYF